MKRIFSLFIVCIILTANCVNAQTYSRLVGLGIIQGDENGDFREDENISRAEFSKMIARILQIDNESFGSENKVFSDVEVNHWASGAIHALNGMGIIHGVGDGTFHPDDDVTFEQAAKILVVVLGYDVLAAERGDYPMGYIVTAGNIGLLKNVNQEQGPITRLTAAQMCDNALDVVPLTVRYGAGVYERGDSTLYDLFIGKDGIIKVEGILTAAGNLSLENEFDTRLKKGYIKIDGLNNKAEYDAYYGLTYKSLNDYSEYLGFYMTGYAQYDEKEDIYVMVNLEPVKRAGSYNEIIITEAGNGKLHNNYFEYYDDMKSNKIDLASNVTYVYNSRVIKNPTDFDKDIYCGQYRLLDNNGDGSADVVFIDEAESMVVERTRSDVTSAVYFANKRIYRNRTSFIFDFDNTNVIYEIKDKSGKNLEFEEIKEGQGITFFASEDESYVKVVLSDETVEGKISGVTHEERNAAVNIGGEDYKLAMDHKGNSILDVKLGDEGIFVLDLYGNIIDMYGDKTTSLSYGYVVGARAKGSSLNSNVQLRIVQGVPPKKEEKVVSGSTSITYYFQNDSIKTYDCIEKVKFFGQMRGRTLQQIDVLEPFEAVNPILSELEGTLIGFTQTADGLIKEIYIFPVPTENAMGFGSSEFNAQNVSFGGEDVANVIGRGYLTNNRTMFICVPNAPKNDDDYYVQIRMTHNSGPHYVYGVKTFFVPVATDLKDYEKRELLCAQPVDVLIIKKDMDASNPPRISETADVCMVGGVSLALGTGFDEGSEIYKLELMKKDKVIQEYTASGGVAYDIASTLVAGDLVRYNYDSFERIAKLERVGRVQGLDEYNADFNTVYGEAINIELNTFDYYYNRMVHNLTLDLGNDGIRTLSIAVENGPPVYMYERSSTGVISFTDIEDVLTRKQVGGGASKIYACYNESNEVSAIVIIK